MFREDGEWKKNQEPTLIAWLELEKGRSPEEPLKEIIAEHRPLTERTQMPIGPVLLLSLQRDGPVGKNRGPASELSGISELRTNLRGVAHTSNESWQMVGTALSCQTVVDSVAGTAPKASLKRTADGSQATVLKPTPKSRPASAVSVKPGTVLSGAGPPPGPVVRGPSSGPRSLVQSRGGKASSSHQEMEVEHVRDDDDDIAFGESVSNVGGIPRGVAMDRTPGSAAMSQVSVPSVISNIQGNMVNIAAVLARFTCNYTVLQWPAASVEDHLELNHWPEGLPVGKELSINHLLLGWDFKAECYDYNSHVYSTAAWGRTESSC